MKALLLSLSLVAALQAQTTAAPETPDASGTWYLKATMSDKAIPVKKLGSVSVTPMSVQTLEGGSLQITFTALIDGQCQEISTVLEKTDEPGTYTSHGGKHVAHVVKSAVEDHYILYGECELHGHRLRMAKLVGRYPYISQEAIEDFEKVAGARGLNMNTIFIPKQRDACSPGSD